MKTNTKIKLLFLSTLAVFLTTAGLRCTLLPAAEKKLLDPIEITWWGVEDSLQDYQNFIGAYRVLHPNITITYRKLREEEFETELLNALAEDRGPDIFTIRNTWTNAYLSKIEPLPPTTKLAFETKQKSLGVKQETLIEVKETPSITARELKNTFLDVVAGDVVRNDQIYGLPLSIDTLVMFYNRDLLNTAGIATPPKNWSEVQEAVKKLTFQNNQGGLIQSGAALGTGENIEDSTDIISLLMMQNGAEMITARGVAFGEIPAGFPDRSYNPGPEAVRFYTDFADPTKAVYTWNQDFGNSIDAFAAGNVAMMFGYNRHVNVLEAKRQGKLNYDIATIPQIEGRNPINYASYWYHTVSKKSTHVNEAWDFVQFISRENQVKTYLEKTKKPTALRSLIASQLEDDQLVEFAGQLLTAKSWYQGNDYSAVVKAFNDMVNSILTGEDFSKTINLAAQKIQQTL